MLVIHPDECIDCGVCVPECPAEAIVADSEPPATEFWLDLNRRYSEIWPNIVSRKPPLENAGEENGREGKLNEFSPNPGSQDVAQDCVSSEPASYETE